MDAPEEIVERLREQLAVRVKAGEEIKRELGEMFAVTAAQVLVPPLSALDTLKHAVNALTEEHRTEHETNTRIRDQVGRAIALLEIMGEQVKKVGEEGRALLEANNKSIVSMLSDIHRTKDSQYAGHAAALAELRKEWRDEIVALRDQAVTQTEKGISATSQLIEAEEVRIVEGLNDIQQVQKLLPKELADTVTRLTREWKDERDTMRAQLIEKYEDLGTSMNAIRSSQRRILVWAMGAGCMSLIIAACMAFLLLR